MAKVTLPPKVGRQTNVAPSGSAPREQAVTEQKIADVPDVFLKGPVLEFRPSDRPLEEAEKRKRATLLLQALRTAVENGTFGDAVRGDLDAPTTLRNYYTCLELCRILVEAVPEAAEEINEFLATLSVPDDLQPVVERAVASADAEEAGSPLPNGKPLGEVRQWEANPELMWNVWGQPACFEITDATVAQLWHRRQNADLAGYVQNFTAEQVIGAARLWTRAKERGSSVTVNPNTLAAPMHIVPATAENAAVFTRLARVFGFDPNLLKLGNQPLGKWANTPAVVKLAGRVPPVGRAVGRPLGDVKTWENQFNLGPLSNALNANDPATGSITDETVRKWFQQWGANGELTAYRGLPSGQSLLSCVKVWRRAKEMNLPQATVHQGGLQAIVNQLPEGAESATELLKLGSAFGFDLSGLIIGRKTLADWAKDPVVRRGLMSSGVRVAVQKARVQPNARQALGEVNTWERGVDFRAWWKAMLKGDASAYRINDATVRRLLDQTALHADLSGYGRGNGPPAARTALINIWAQAKELGCVRPQVNWQVYEANFRDGLNADAETAAALLRLGAAFEHPVEHLVLGHRSLADWSKDPDVRRLVSLPRSRKEKRRSPLVKGQLGDTRDWDHDPNYNNWWNAVNRGNPLARTPTDTMIARLFTEWGFSNNDLTAYMQNNLPQQDAGALVLAWARGRERGLNAQFNAAGAQQVAQGLKPTPADAAALRRLGAAYDFDPEDLLLGNQKAVRSFPRVKASAASHELPKVERLGQASLSEAQIAELIEKKDARLFELDDASLALLRKRPFVELATVRVDQKWQLGLLKAAQRCLELKGAAELSSDDLKAYLLRIPVGMLSDEKVVEAIVETAYRAGLAAAAVVLSNASNLAANRLAQDAVARLERRLLGSSAPVERRRTPPVLLPEPKPIGDVPGPYMQYWRARDLRFTQLNDAVWQNELPDVSGIPRWLSQFQGNPRVFLAIARICELNPRRTGPRNVQQFLANPVEQRYVTVESLPWIARMAKAADVDLANVRVATAQGDVVPLLEHPDFPKADKAGATERAAALADDLSLLDAKNAVSAADREGAVLRLLSVTDPEHEITHEYGELLDAVGRADAAGGRQRISLTDGPDAHRAETYAAAFSGWDHPGAIAVLSGLLFDAKAADVEKLLLDKNVLPSVAKESARIAERISKLKGDELSFVLKDTRVGHDQQPDFSALGLRTLLLEQKPDRAAVLKAFDEVDPEFFVQSLVQRAAGSPEDDPVRGVLLGALRELADEGELDPELVRATVDARTAARLEAKTLQALDKAVGEFQLAAGDDKPNAAGKVLELVRAGSALFGVRGLAGKALELSYAKDLTQVAPLAEVDEAVGPVPGKELFWSGPPSGSQDAPDEVEVGGVKLKALGVNARAEAADDLSQSTPTAEKHLRLLASRYLMGGDFQLSAANAAEATSLVLRLAGALKAPFERVEVGDDLQVLADGSAAAAVLAEGGLLHVVGHGAWPAGLKERLSQLMRADGGRVILQNDAKTPPPNGIGALSLPAVPVEEMLGQIKPHLEIALGAQAAQKLLDAYSKLSALEKSGKLGGRGLEGAGVELLARVADRVARFQKNGAPVELLLRRELEEIFLQRLAPGAAESARATLELLGPEPVDAPLALDVQADHVQVGDVSLPRADKTSGARAAPELSRGHTEGVYRLAKALAQREPVFLAGADAAGLVSRFAELTGESVHPHLLSAHTKVNDLLGEGVTGVFHVEEFSAAPREVQRALLAAARSGQIHLVATGEAAPPPEQSGAFSLQQLWRLDAPDDRRESAARLAREHGMPEAVGRAVADLQHWMQDTAKPDEVVRADAEAQAQLISHVANLKSTLGTAAAFTAVIEAWYSSVDPERAAEIETRAKELVA